MIGPGSDKNSHILPTGQRYAPSAVNYSAYSAHSAQCAQSACTILHYLALSCAFLHYLALSCTILHHLAPSWTMLHHVAPCYSMLQHVAPCCSTLQHVAPCCTLLHHVAPCCTVLHHVAGVSILTSQQEKPPAKKLPIFSELIENSAKFIKNSGLTKWTQNLRQEDQN